MAQKTTITAQLYKQGKSHQWLADQVGVTTGTIARWMTNRRPQHYSTMRKVADLLLCEPGDLWPEVRIPINWEHRYQVITDRLLTLSPHQDREEFLRLCSERAAASVHIYIAQCRKASQSTPYHDDGYTVPYSVYSRL